MAKKKDPRWMEKVFSKHPGAFRRKASKAGKSTKAFAKAEEHAPGKTGQQARLAERGMEAAKKGGRHSPIRKALDARGS